MKRQIVALLRSWRLLWYLVRADVTITYKRKALGYLWTLLDPLMLMVVYVVLVEVIFKRGTAQFPVLLFSALLAWKWFQASLQEATLSIARKAKLVRTVSFSRVVLPIEPVLSGLVRYVLSLAALIPMLILFHAHITVYVLWLPVIVGIQLMFTIGCALICGVVGSYFADLQNILVFGLRMWFYLSPALFSVEERIPARLSAAYMAVNPFSSLFTAYKNILVLGAPPPIEILATLGYGVAGTALGFWLFDRYDNRIVRDL